MVLGPNSYHWANLNNIKKYLPELKNMPSKYLFKPWQAPQQVLEQARVVLGQDYPYPIVDLKESRNIALQAYDENKSKNNN